MRQRSPVGTLILTLLLAVAVIAPLHACSVPVFRYALERWPADHYQVTVVHRGPLTDAQQALVDRLNPESAHGPKAANLRVKAVDLDDKDGDAAAGNARDEALSRLGGQIPAELPVMIVNYPVDKPPAWTGPLNEENVARLIDSPVRREVARRLLKGETAVWVFLESGNKEEDEKAFETIKTELALAGLNMKLPEIEQQDVDDGLVSIELDQLRIAFSLIRVNRADSAESLFVETLLGSEGTDPDSLRDPQFAGQPMVFPIFGRGRALYALVGKGINEETINTACKTLIGPCTCEVKDQNPGIDMLMSIAWNDLVQSTIDIDKELPPLTGLTTFLNDDKPGPDATSTDATSKGATEDNSAAATTIASITATPPLVTKPQVESADASKSASAPASQVAVSPAPRGAVEPAAGMSSVLRNTLILVGLVAGVVIVASLLVVRKG